MIGGLIIAIQNDLRKAFKDIKFNKEKHQYYIPSIIFKNEVEKYTGGKCKDTKIDYVFPVSVTEFIDKFLLKKDEKFDEKHWSEYVAKRDNKTVEEVLNDWREKAEKGAKLGSVFHEMAEGYYKGYNSTIHIPYILAKQFHDFINDTKDNLIPIESELAIGSERLTFYFNRPAYSYEADYYNAGIAGTIDQLFWSKKDDGIILFDWKTNKKFYGWNEDEVINNDLDFLDHKNVEVSYYNSLCYQTYLYKTILEAETKLEIKDCYVGWFSKLNKKYRIIKCNGEPLSQKIREITGGHYGSLS